MPEIEQHLPAYVTAESQRAKFNTLRELFAIDFVAHFAKGNFFRYSLTERSYTGTHCFMHLMAEYDNGRKWWVVGLIWDDFEDESVLNDIVKWQPNYDKATPSTI